MITMCNHTTAKLCAECMKINLIKEKETNAHKLYEALTKLVECIETVKFERRPDGSPPDWYDWGFINQELKKAKKVLGGEG